MPERYDIGPDGISQIEQVKILNDIKRKNGQKVFKRKPQPIKYPFSIERTYQARFLSTLTTFQEEIRRYVISQLGNFLSLKSAARKDDYVDDIDNAFELAEKSFVQKVTPDIIRSYVGATALSVEMWNKKEIKELFRKAIGVDIFTDDTFLGTEIKAFTQENVGRITSLLATEKEAVKNLVLQEVRAGRRSADIAKLIEHKFSVDANRAKLIARDQVGKFHGDLTHVRQVRVGIKKYIWRTMRDEIVRPNHNSKEGNVYSWDKPPEDTGHPGSDIACRCYAEPVIEV